MKISILIVAISVLSLTGCKSNDGVDDSAQVKKKSYHCEKVSKLGSMIPKTRCITQAEKKREERESKEAFRDARSKHPIIKSGG